MKFKIFTKKNLKLENRINIIVEYKEQDEAYNKIIECELLERNFIMKKFRSFVALCLAMVMAFSFSSVAFAAEQQWYTSWNQQTKILY